MSHLTFPFKKSITIKIINDKIKTSIECEAALTDIEIFQALKYRKKKDFSNPLILKFPNPLLQTFASLNFSFPIELIAVDHKTHLVKKAQPIKPTKAKGAFIQGFSEFSLVLLAPIGFGKKHKIEVDKTIIK